MITLEKLTQEIRNSEGPDVRVLVVHELVELSRLSSELEKNFTYENLVKFDEFFTPLCYFSKYLSSGIGDKIEVAPILRAIDYFLYTLPKATNVE
jgi:hypothetical protein